MPTQTTPPSTPNSPLGRAIAESQDALATMEAEAADYFASRASGDAAAALNPVAPALEEASRTPAPPKATARSAPAAAPAAAKAAAKAPAALETAPAAPNAAANGAPATGKVAGAPTLTAIAAPKPVPTDAKPTADAPTTASTDPFADVSRDYTPGKTRAPQWDRLHAKADHYEALSTQRAQEISDLQAALESAKAAAATGAPSPDLQQRLSTLQAERDALQSRLEAVAVERSPRFEAQFKPRRDAALAQAKAAVGPAEAARIEQLLAMGESSFRDEQVESLLASLPPLRATKLTQAVADLDRLALERSSLAAQGSELWKTWTAEEAAARDRAAAERTARAASTFDTEAREWERAGITPAEIDAARSVYTGKDATLQDASRAALWGAVGPRVATQLVEARSRITELEGELTRLRGAQPGVGAAASGALPSTGGDDDDDPTIGYSERIARQALKAGVRFGS